MILSSHRFPLLLLALLAIILSVNSLAQAQEQYGTLISKKQIAAPFLMFDKADTNVFFVRDQTNMDIRITAKAPELQCFLVNHLQGDLRVRYAIYQNESTGHAVRTNYLLELVSLSTGDNLKEWPAKELADTTAFRIHHEKLAEYFKHPTIQGQ